MHYYQQETNKLGSSENGGRIKLETETGETRWISLNAVQLAKLVTRIHDLARYETTEHNPAQPVWDGVPAQPASLQHLITERWSSAVKNNNTEEMVRLVNGTHVSDKRHIDNGRSE